MKEDTPLSDELVPDTNYPVFEKDQLLTSGDLEDLHEYLDETDRTRNEPVTCEPPAVAVGAAVGLAAFLGYLLGRRCGRPNAG